MPPSPLFWLLVAAALWLLVLLGLDGDGLLLVGGTAALALTLLGAAISLPAWAQALLFFSLAAAGYGLLRRWSLRSTAGDALLPPPTDQAQVISAFSADGSGRVQWQGQSWAAHNVEPHTPLSPGERVIVMGREGNCLQVMARNNSGP
ncbi:MAG: NfeD family protein [Cyanobacteriota bacterium]|nr:NfeD family protein [Cyanobacteriota bacterium]